VDVGDGGFGGVGVCGDFDLVGKGCPVCALVQESARVMGEGEEGGKYHHNNVLDAVGESFIAAFLPVGCRGGFFT
jgi:hypothetical protein